MCIKIYAVFIVTYLVMMYMLTFHWGETRVRRPLSPELVSQFLSRLQEKEGFK